MKKALEDIDIFKLLEKNKIDRTFTDVADLLWLYFSIGGESQSSEDVNNKETKEEKEKSQRQDTSDNNKEQEESTKDTEANNRSSLHTNDDKKDGKSKGNYFKTPTRKQFNQFNQFATVFKILKQFSNSSSEQEFNENETIEYIANTNVWNIQTTPKKELKYTLFIVIEKSTSMRIWEEITQEFVSALSRFSFFKDVQVVYLKELDEKYQLYRDKQCNKKVSTKLFNSQTQRTLTILLSDCISKGWQDKRGYSFLDEVTAVTPFLIVNMLPQRVWNRTMVNDSWRVKFTHRNGWKNSSLVSDEEDDIKEEFDLEKDSKEDFIRIPMTTLEKIPLKHWSNVIAGYKNNWLHGSLFEAEVFDLDIPPKDEIKRTPSSSIAPEQQVKNFYAYASPLAHELAVYFSAVPILSIEIMKMIQKTSLPKTNYTHLAEVFLSGLLKRGKFKTKANDDTYLFRNKIIKEVLSKRLPPQLKEKIRESNSEFIEEHLGHLQEFQAVVESDEGSVDGVSSDGDDGFASVANEGTKPAIFKTVTERIQISPARTEWKKTTSDDPDFEEKTELIDVPAEYRMVTKKVIVTPERQEEEKIIDVVVAELLSIGWEKKNILRNYKLPSNKRVDILVRSNEKNFIVIEVKAPSSDVKSGLDQVILHGKELGIDNVYSTNGVEIYRYSISSDIGIIEMEYPPLNSIVKQVKKVLLSELNQWKKSFENISFLSENIEFVQSVNNSIFLINKLIEIVNISEYEDLEPLFDVINELEKSKKIKEKNKFLDNPFKILTHELREVNSFLYSLSSLVIYDDSKEAINNLINNLNKILDIINNADIFELEELLTKKNTIVKGSSQLTTKLGRGSIVGREKELSEINKLLNNSSILLLNGIGGIGKTTLASYYLHSQTDKLDYYGFFEGIESFVNELREPLKLKQEKQQDAFIEALTTLKQLEGEKLLVIDDVRDIEENQENIERILELKNSGYKILLTSREDIYNIDSYYLNTLSIDDAKKLFNSIYEVENEVLLEEILSYLDYHAFFIERTALALKSRKILTPQMIIDKFRKGEFSTIKYKRKDSFNNYLNKLFSFDELDDEEILMLKQLSILPSIEIKFELLEEVFDRKNDEKFKEILNYLSEKGWLNSFEDGYKLSQIIKEYILTNYLPSFEEIEKIVDFFIELISHGKDIQTIAIENKENIIYFDSLNNMLNILNVENEKIATFLAYLGNFYRSLLEYEKTEEVLLKALKIRKRIFGENHILTATTYSNIGILYRLMGKYEQSLVFQKKSLKIRESILGEEHLETAQSYNNIALLYENIGNYQKALEYYNKDLKVTKKIQGEEHPDIATTYNNLANLYKLLHKYSEALELYKKSLTIREHFLGEEHLLVAQSYNNLGTLYLNIRKYQEALMFLKKALSLEIKLFGKEDIAVATTYNNLGTIYIEIQDYEKGFYFHQKSLGIREKVLGNNHLDTAQSYTNLSYYYSQVKEYPIAYKYMKKAIKIKKKNLPESHPDLIQSINSLSVLSKYLSSSNNHIKIARNEPCPCGSGKKYKKCCGKN